jgi:5-methylcytosine-specific restriction enzyme A
MSTNRTSIERGWIYSTNEKGPNGRGLCRRCSTEVPKGRRTFCSDDCVHEWKLRTDPGYLRRCVLARDRGICAFCGLDTEALREEYQRLENASRWHISISWKREHGIPEHRNTFWDADHILPVAEGGGECDLSNMRTLCIPCHKKASAELAARLKKPKVQEKIQDQLQLWAGEASMYCLVKREWLGSNNYSSLIERYGIPAWAKEEAERLNQLAHTEWDADPKDMPGDSQEFDAPYEVVDCSQVCQGFCKRDV